ncbi:MAG: hypothetical protein AAB800_03250 [Patescibacteria group bacterium]
MPRTVKIGLIASFLLLLTVNIVMLDLVVIYKRPVVGPVEMNAVTVRMTPTPSPGEICSSSCQSKIDALNRRIDSISAESAQQSTSILPTKDTVKEYYITLGSGTTKSSVWEDVAGIESVIDTINYPSIKSIVFEVFLNIPTANGVAKAKLYNVTDKHDVWFSEVSSEGPSLTKKEASISLDRGAKTYRVMGLSSLKYDANIVNARIRIVTN